MGAYVPVGGANSPATSLTGLPLATANDYAAGSNGAGTSKTSGQSQSRPMILNRPFRSVAEMSYTFRGGLWKQIDFFTPESGDAALLDTFCLNEPSADGMVAGKVNLNTRQVPVLKALLAGAYREELANVSGIPTGYAKSALDSSEANNIATALAGITSNTTNAWQGPLANAAEIVGRFVPTPGNTAGAKDVYAFTEPLTNVSYTYAGLSAALDSGVYSGASAKAPQIQRLRESAIRPLVAAGQTRVWNLMIDVVAQAGQYPSSATAAADLPKFVVQGERRFWVHVAIDRLTGQVIDKQVEVVTE